MRPIPQRNWYKLLLPQVQNLFFSFGHCLFDLPASSTNTSSLALILNTRSGTHQLSYWAWLDITSSWGHLPVCIAGSEVQTNVFRTLSLSLHYSCFCSVSPEYWDAVPQPDFLLVSQWAKGEKSSQADSKISLVYTVLHSDSLCQLPCPLPSLPILSQLFPGCD
jgi:hypothetical protein